MTILSFIAIFYLPYFVNGILFIIYKCVGVAPSLKNNQRRFWSTRVDSDHSVFRAIVNCLFIYNCICKCAKHLKQCLKHNLDDCEIKRAVTECHYFIAILNRDIFF